ncbi:CoA-acylating methylmalonate-semialdehyde dehydrogenase [Corallincola spongiicola]|uniref:methylmalonate-semialdehyde dehydrogenase (CoA acylating) n=2 Tax=Corallincola spongiicola TaxID=2520508 RepID=A0ABY1WT40_9GAMM|nr:CoA-acylating methylmalonate-semialdehyde dehydrogenase [Corallincola spongiicola]
MMQQVKHLINGEWQLGEGQPMMDVVNPANQNVLATQTAASDLQLERAVAAAELAFLQWREVPAPERARLMLNFQHSLKLHHDELGELLAQDTGKTFADAKGDVWRGIEVVEQACGIASQMMGETLENAARGIDCYSYLQPLGVCAGITPFNFPAMIPLWMFPLATACGNSFILKPSEQDPLVPNRIAELFVECGAPKNLLQVLHGGPKQVDALLTHPDIKAVSFVGSAPVAEHIYHTGSQHNKRVQAFAGAKNHMVVMPDANASQVVNALVGASVGAAGQRCMAISVAVLVGDAKALIPQIQMEMKKVRPGVWNDPEAGYGPLISAASKQRVAGLIQQGIEEGAECLLDGRDFRIADLTAADGNWLGPTLFANVTPEMAIYQQEIFGPVLLLMTADSLDDALTVINRNPFGNGCSIFTSSGAAARTFQREVTVGQVGINVPIPVPLPCFSFTGWKGSFFGDLHAYGKQAVRFYTETKTITSRWFDGDVAGAPNMTIQLK